MNDKNSIQPGRYRHYKGNEYTVVGTARHSETLEEMIVYRQEYGQHGLWVRPKSMFTETVEVDGRQVPRFEFLGPVESEAILGVQIRQVAWYRATPGLHKSRSWVVNTPEPRIYDQVRWPRRHTRFPLTSEK